MKLKVCSLKINKIDKTLARLTQREGPTKQNKIERGEIATENLKDIKKS